MFDWLGLGKVVSDVANELIDTPEEKVRVFNLKLKTLDLNGIMRRGSAGDGLAKLVNSVINVYTQEQKLIKSENEESDKLHPSDLKLNTIKK